MLVCMGAPLPEYAAVLGLLARPSLRESAFGAESA